MISLTFIKVTLKITQSVYQHILLVSSLPKNKLISWKEFNDASGMKSFVKNLVRARCLNQIMLQKDF